MREATPAATPMIEMAVMIPNEKLAAFCPEGIGMLIEEFKR